MRRLEVEPHWLLDQIPCSRAAAVFEDPERALDLVNADNYLGRTSRELGECRWVQKRQEKPTDRVRALTRYPERPSSPKS